MGLDSSCPGPISNIHDHVLPSWVMALREVCYYLGGTQAVASRLDNRAGGWSSKDLCETTALQTVKAMSDTSMDGPTPLCADFHQASSLRTRRTSFETLRNGLKCRKGLVSAGCRYQNSLPLNGSSSVHFKGLGSWQRFLTCRICRMSFLSPRTSPSLSLGSEAVCDAVTLTNAH